MTVSELSGYLDRLESTSSRNELVKTLAELYAKSSPDEIQPLTYLIQGRLVPFFEPVEIGLGEKLVMAAIAQAFAAPADEVSKLFGQLGDLGLVAAKLSVHGSRAELPVSEVHARLMEIAAAAGTGSVEKKRSLFAALLKQVDPISAKHLVRIALGRLRLGIGDPTVLDGLSFARKGDRSLRPVLEGAYNRASDLGLIAKTFWSGGESAVNALEVTVGRPIRSQLAERLPNPEAVIKKLGLVAVQPKYDGIRVQIHKNGSAVRVFSRNLEDYTLMFSELTTAAEGLKDDTLILDGEAIAYSKELEEYLPFQLTASRRRQHGIEQAALELPLVAFIFDILYRNGRDLTDLPYEERLALVDEVIAGSTVLLPAPIIKTDSVEVLTKTLLDSISQGLEGVVVKRPESKYQAGARNFNWVKLKRHTSGELNDTVDLVLLGYYFGKGKRADFGVGALLAGVYDAENDRFATITKLGTGLSDAEWRKIRERADKLQVDQRPARVDSILVPDVWLKPEVVVEVMADEITPSPRHTAGKVGDKPGFALRFPRVVSFRAADKRPEDATTVKEIAELFGQQRERKQPA
ncbi:MAG: ATP-dependent DNA ligase [Chloroflexi bacterium]|nr:MAG: ATP-dependent DNA ligase [Chloroflexota bacterium]TMD84886.1 MAG: ATP-dependent DNA ligase [Chloroflexota bacterium]